MRCFFTSTVRVSFPLLVLAVIAILAGCRGTESPEKSSGSASAENAGATTKDSESTGSESVVNAPSQTPVELEWVQGALSEAVVRTGKELGNLYLPETTGGGIAAFDFDRDGWSDLVCAGGGKADGARQFMVGSSGALYRNRTVNDEQISFASVREQSKLDFSHQYNTGIAIADVDADGFQDVFIAGYSMGQLFRNQGDGTFEWMEGKQVGLGSTLWGASAAFFDMDSDGLVDLYVANYANWSFDNNPVCGNEARSGGSSKSSDYCGPREFQGLPDVLYRNGGDGTFEDRTKDAGMEDNLRGLGVVAADWDLDGDVDLYVANDVDPNLLYRNDGGGKFTEIGRRAGVATNDAGTPEGSMGLAVGDYNMDGKPDLWVTNYQNELGALYRNSGNLVFNYASLTARIAATDEASVGWGTAFCDVDGDGDEDLLVLNGHIELHPRGSTVDQRPQVLLNQGGKSFLLAPRGESPFLQEPQNARGLAMADWNRDGKMDFVASRVDRDAALVLNRTGKQRSVRLRLVGTASNRDAIGARVKLKVGSYEATRQVIGGGSYASSHEGLLHIAVPAEHWVSGQKESASLVIDWPNGKRDEHVLEDWDREWIVVEGERLP